MTYEESDHFLLQKISKGDARSFNRLYKKYWKHVYDSAFKRLKNHDGAQDVTQEIFTAIWLKRDTLQISDLPAYLHIAVRNRVLNVFEKEKRYVPFEQLLYDHACRQNEFADAETLNHEFLRAYRALVNSMPERRRKIFHFHFDEGFSTEEIAQDLSLSRKTVQNQLGRAVTFLKTNLSYLISLLIYISLSFS